MMYNTDGTIKQLNRIWAVILLVTIMILCCSRGMAQQSETNLIAHAPFRTTTTELTTIIPSSIGDCQPIVPFEQYYDTVSVKFLVSDESGKLYAINGFEVYEHTYRKGKGWQQQGMLVGMDCDEHLRYLLYRLDINKKKLYNLTVWQTK